MLEQCTVQDFQKKLDKVNEINRKRHFALWLEMYCVLQKPMDTFSRKELFSIFESIHKAINSDNVVFNRMFDEIKKRG